MSQENIIQAKSWIGSVTFNPTLENGWNLTGLNATADSKTAELLTSVAGFIPKSLLSTGGAEPGQIKPGMYRLLFETDPKKPNYGQLIGIDLKPVFTIGQ